MPNKLYFEKFRVFQVVVPAREDILSAPVSKSAIYSGNLSWPELPIFLVEGVTNTGITAVGETDRGTSQATLEATLHDLLGRDLLAATPATMWMSESDAVGLPSRYPYWSWEVRGERSYLLMESLWLDAVGKATGLPAHTLLGGAVRKVVPTDFWANRPSAAVMAKLIGEAQERGLRGIKMKSDGSGDTARALLEIAADVPAGFRVTIDPMTAWRSLRESARWFDALAKLDCDIQIEDPFPHQAIEDWQRARGYSPITIICHPRGEANLRLALREEMADGYNLGLGSTYNFLQMAHVIEAADKDCWQGSSLELGVGQHVRLHAAACARSCVLGSDMQSEWVREHTLITPRMAYADGGAIVPDRPGLGIELDRGAVSGYCQREFDVMRNS
ncbi:MAG: enolase C-terminal domain-like protein [Caldilineaceae bacterium]